MGASAVRVGHFFCNRNLGKRVPAGLAERGWNVERHDGHIAQDTPDDAILREIAARGWMIGWYSSTSKQSSGT
jgi:hypothetical protein